MSEIKGLSGDFLAELMANKRGRGSYDPKLALFMESDEPGIDPAEEWPLEFGTKSAAAMVQSFKAAAKRADVLDELSIMNRDDKCFIIHLARANARINGTEDNENGEVTEAEDNEAEDN